MSQELLAHEAYPDLTLEERLESRRQQRLKLALELGGDAVGLYFHGTNYPHKPGDEIFPQGQAIEDEEGKLNASASRYEEGAWHYAESKEDLEGGRGRVYTVVPSDGKPPQHLGPQYGEVNSPAFTVVEQIDVMPGRQGTLPDINWNQYSKYSHQNHPQDPPLTFHEGWEEPNRPSPNDVPLPDLEAQVKQELERERVASGRPEL